MISMWKKKCHHEALLIFKHAFGRGITGWPPSAFKSKTFHLWGYRNVVQNINSRQIVLQRPLFIISLVSVRMRVPVLKRYLLYNWNPNPHHAGDVSDIMPQTWLIHAIGVRRACCEDF